MKFSQLPHTLLMIRPGSFGFNSETFPSNSFQAMPSGGEQVQQKALEEFERMVTLLQAHEIQVMVFGDDHSESPDAVFPNNWISFHHQGSVILYPMMAPNRRRERRKDIIEALAKDFVINEVINLSIEEENNTFLEGTGSLVFDHPNRHLYASHSPRTDKKLALRVAEHLGYQPVFFHAVDEHDQPVYHTNVVLSIGSKFVLICLDAIRDDTEQETLLQKFSDANRKVIAISYAQMRAFSGNVFEVQTREGDPVILMSEMAFRSFLPGQLNAMGAFAEILPLKIDTIEKYGGGSVRCMIAGIHLPK